MLLEPERGDPYLGRTQSLRKRLRRLLELRLADGGRYGDRIQTVRFRPTGSPFEMRWLLWRIGRRLWPDDYRRRLRLHPPPVLKLLVRNRFPYTSITTRLSGRRTLEFGPFRSRAAAEEFQDRILDCFGIRRCVENLKPDPDHPGCVFGEIGKCLRPCQQAISDERYAAETDRFAETLRTGGASLRAELERERDEASAALEFETAASLHQKLGKLETALQAAEAPAADLDRLHGAVLQRAADGDAILIWPLRAGLMEQPLRLSLEADGGLPQALQQELQELWPGRSPAAKIAARQREDSLALFRRWFFSSRREGAFTAFEDPGAPPFRRLARAARRVLTEPSSRDFQTAAMRERDRQARRDRFFNEQP